MTSGGCEPPLSCRLRRWRSPGAPPGGPVEGLGLTDADVPPAVWIGRSKRRASAAAAAVGPRSRGGVVGTGLA